MTLRRVAQPAESSQQGQHDGIRMVFHCGRGGGRCADRWRLRCRWSLDGPVVAMTTTLAQQAKPQSMIALFYWFLGGSEGGWGDLQGIFPTVDEAITARDGLDEEVWTWKFAEIVDLSTATVIGTWRQDWGRDGLTPWEKISR